MKKLFILIGAALALASCSRDISLNENKGNPINFSTEVGTKANTLVTTDNLNYFYATAITTNSEKYFEKQYFEKQTGGAFTSSPEYYWPGDGSKLTFYSYASTSKTSAEALAPVYEGGKYVIKGYVPVTEVQLQEDLVYGFAIGDKTNESTPLTMEMSHALTKISLKAKNSNEGYKYVVSGVRLGRVGSKGDFTFPTSLESTGGWTLSEDKTSYDYDFSGSPITLNGTAAELNGPSAEFMIIPQQQTLWNCKGNGDDNNGSYLAVKVKITTKAGAQVYDGWAAAPIGENWEQGNSYTYILDFSKGAGYVDPTSETNPGMEILGEAISFEVEVTGWSSGFSNVNM